MSACVSVRCVVGVALSNCEVRKCSVLLVRSEI